jgi:hypothetical protein
MGGYLSMKEGVTTTMKRRKGARCAPLGAAAPLLLYNVVHAPLLFLLSLYPFPLLAAPPFGECL